MIPNRAQASLGLSAIVLSAQCCSVGIQQHYCWDLLYVCMQVRAMQIIDELEVNKRGPYGGGMGYVAYNGNMDIALALRTMVIPNPPPSQDPATNGSNGNPKGRKKWTVHLQVRLALSFVSCVEWLGHLQRAHSGCCVHNLFV